MLCRHPSRDGHAPERGGDSGVAAINQTNRRQASVLAHNSSSSHSRAHPRFDEGWMARRLVCLVGAFGLALAGALATGAEAAPASLSQREVARLQQEIAQLKQRGRYADAVPLAERVLAASEKAKGPE